MANINQYKELSIERKLLLDLARRRRWAHRDYLWTKSSDHENRLITLHVWIAARNAHIVAHDIVNRYFKGE